MKAVKPMSSKTKRHNRKELALRKQRKLAWQAGVRDLPKEVPYKGNTSKYDPQVEDKKHGGRQ